MASKPISPRVIAYTLSADIFLVLVFAALGRSSHQEGNPITGVLYTALPFLLALLLSWLLLRLWRNPLEIWPQGVLLWAGTVLGGIGLRLLSGRTAELPFVLVASLVLAAFLLGHRLVAGYILRRKGSKKS